jgi:hypothetical protein
MMYVVRALTQMAGIERVGKFGCPGRDDSCTLPFAREIQFSPFWNMNCK